MKAKKQNHIGFEISTERGPVIKPTHFLLWDESAISLKQNAKIVPRKPLKYYADILLGFSYMELFPQNNHPLSKKCRDLWTQLDPHLALYHESQERVRAIAKQGHSHSPTVIRNFETAFTETLHNCMDENGIDLKEVTHLVDTIQYLEEEIKSPILFNFNCHFSPEFTKILQAFESFLFNLRNVIAVDHNHHIEDPSHEALKVDSVLDYLPKGDYVVSDAVLYWNVKKLTLPFVAGSRSDVRVEKLLIQPIESVFHQYAHNACYLIDHLPYSFLSKLNHMEMEDTLYLVQMDWLLGSGTGLLFKIREELYGLQSGYEKIFWHELENRPSLKPAKLSIHLEFSEEELTGVKVAS